MSGITVSATITVVRDDVEIEVRVEGDIEHFGSANPFERGESIGDWCVMSPDGLVLTPDERADAEQALENAK